MGGHTGSTTILVTGGAGFVGSNLCERLAKDGYRVISLDNYFTGSVANHVPGVTYRVGHTKDIAQHIPEKPDIVFHLGEYARTEKSFEDVELVADLNQTGTFAVVEFCRKTGAKLVYAGSSTKFADEGEGRDQSPYAWSKAINTELVKNYGTWFGLKYAIVYFYNVYGPREMSGAYGTLIKIFADLTTAGQPLMVTSPGTQLRNFTHVDDIVDGLIVVAEKGEGDDYGIGADQSYSVLDVAHMYGGEIIMMPPRKGNRMSGGVNNTKVKELGWIQKHTLPAHIEEWKRSLGTPKQSEPLRVLVFSTTFLPDAGAAEHALVDLMAALPQAHFDVVTTVSKTGEVSDRAVPTNVTVHRVGKGTVLDKYLLPLLGARVARSLVRQHRYAFMWSLFASYAALAALMTTSRKRLPLLITLADQRIDAVPWYTRLFLRRILGAADQVYANDTASAKIASRLSKRTSLLRSIGTGDALANQVRFAYSNMLRARTHTSKKT
jgi:UDP-glucose 4-epimerase